MNSENIGKFIKQLRTEKGWTQEDLANKVSVGREAISKWERGKTSPDSSLLLILSNLFDVTVNEILIGERETKKNATLELYDDRNEINKKLKKVVFGSIVFVFILLFLFFCYYFVNQYRSIHVYTVYGYNDNFEIKNGLFIKTNGKFYFNIGNIENINELQITRLDLYYTENNKESLIYSSNSENIYFYDYKGYEEYFDLKKINIILNNLYVKISYDNKEEIIKLNFVEDYVNDKLFFSNDSSVSNDNVSISEINNSNELKKIILNNFKNENNIYFYELKEETVTIKYTYIEESVLLVINIMEKNKNIKEYIYDLNFDTITYYDYLNNEENGSFTFSDITECKNIKCEVAKEFNEYLKKIINI